jgi:hypothetical protein
MDILEEKMSKPKSKELIIVEWSSKWNDEQNGFSDFRWVIVHKNKILCQGMKRYPFIIYSPILWKDHKAAKEWIESGSIGELQESFSNLNVSFSKNFLERLYD